MELDTILAIVRVYAGLLLAGHGAQKVFGWFGGRGLEGFSGMVGKIGIRPTDVWTRIAAFGELVGGVALAVGLLTGLAAAVLLVDMVVVIWKVHWPNGFWNTNGGYEFPLTLAMIFGAFGLLGARAFSLDAALAIVGWSAPLFLAATVLGLLAVWGSTRPKVRVVERAGERGRRIA